MTATNSSIADALFTKAQQRVLGLLYGNHEQSFYLNEIVRHAAMGKGAVSRELLKLAGAGLLTITKVGNQTHYQANAASPIFTELKQIVQKSVGVVVVVKNALASLLPELEQAFIYGSVAKGEESTNSDIDVMLVANELSYSHVMELLDSAEQQLARTINPTLLTPDEFRARLTKGQSFLTRVMEQPKLWLKEP